MKLLNTVIATSAALLVSSSAFAAENASFLNFSAASMETFNTKWIHSAKSANALADQTTLYKVIILLLE